MAKLLGVTLAYITNNIPGDQVADRRHSGQEADCNDQNTQKKNLVSNGLIPWIATFKHFLVSPIISLLMIYFHFGLTHFVEF